MHLEPRILIFRLHLLAINAAKPKIKPLNSNKPVLLQSDFITPTLSNKTKHINSPGREYSNFLKNMSDEDTLQAPHCLQKCREQGPQYGI